MQKFIKLERESTTWWRRMDTGTDKHTYVCTDGHTDGQTYVCMYGWTHGQTNIRMYVCTNGRTRGPADARTVGQRITVYNNTFHKQANKKWGSNMNLKRCKTGCVDKVRDFCDASITHHACKIKTQSKCHNRKKIQVVNLQIRGPFQYQKISHYKHSYWFETIA